jgi:tetratricopeptide (TPR) repeat protein
MITENTTSSALFEEKVGQYCKAAAQQFKQITRYYVLFHALFLLLACAEIFAFLLFFSFLTQSTLLAFSLAALFLTGFSYFVLKFYFQAKKPEQLHQLQDTYLSTCQEAIPFEKGQAEYHLSMTHAIYQFVSHLQHKEPNYYRLPKLCNAFTPVVEKFSIWNHWKDVHDMKEMLLLSAVREHIHLIKAEPTDLEAHASLANAYLFLSKIYLPPKLQWVPPAYFSKEMQEKFETISRRAIEEFNILDHYAPNDPWVHAQLAAIYHDLEMPEREVHAYETILKITPHDKEVLFRLGILYFEQGLSAKGLRVYEQLKKNNDPKAAELISHYDAALGPV